jgi:hypothetical protein
MRESKIEAYLAEKVKALGGEVRKLRWVGRNGAPDRVVMLPPDVCRAHPTVWVELKAPGAKPRPHQAREHNRMRRNGQQVLVLDSFAAVDAAFAALVKPKAA